MLLFSLVDLYYTQQYIFMKTFYIGVALCILLTITSCVSREQTWGKIILMNNNWSNTEDILQLWIDYSIRDGKLFYWEEELFFNGQNSTLTVDMTSIVPLSYTFFKDSQHVYARSVQDSGTFGIVENADSATFTVPNKEFPYQWMDKDSKYSFFNRVTSFNTGVLNTASCQWTDCE